MEKVRITYKDGNGGRVTGYISKVKALEIFEMLLEKVKYAARGHFNEEQKTESVTEENFEVVGKAEPVVEEISKTAGKTEPAAEEISKTVGKTEPVTAKLHESVGKIASETTETSDKMQTSYEKILIFLRENEGSFRVADVCNHLGMNKNTVYQYMNQMIKKGEIKHPEGKSSRWYCAVKYVTQPEEVAEKEEIPIEEASEEESEEESHPEEVSAAAEELDQPEELSTAAEELNHPEELSTAAEEESSPEELSMAAEELNHPEELSTAAEEESPPEEVSAAAEELDQPEEVTITEIIPQYEDDTQLSKLLEERNTASIMKFLLTKRQFRMNTTMKLFDNETAFMKIIKFLQEREWIMCADEDSGTYKVSKYANIWYLLKESNGPLSLIEIMAKKNFIGIDDVQTALKKGLIDEIVRDGQKCYVAKIK